MRGKPFGWISQSVDSHTIRNVEEQVARSAALKAAIATLRAEYMNWPPCLPPAMEELAARREGAERFVAGVVWC